MRLNESDHRQEVFEIGDDSSFARRLRYVIGALNATSGRSLLHWIVQRETGVYCPG